MKRIPEGLTSSPPSLSRALTGRGFFFAGVCAAAKPLSSLFSVALGWGALQGGGRATGFDRRGEGGELP